MRSPDSVLDDTARRLHRLVEPIHRRAGAVGGSGRQGGCFLRRQVVCISRPAASSVGRTGRERRDGG